MVQDILLNNTTFYYGPNNDVLLNLLKINSKHKVLEPQIVKKLFYETADEWIDTSISSEPLLRARMVTRSQARKNRLLQMNNNILNQIQQDQAAAIIQEAGDNIANGLQNNEEVEHIEEVDVIRQERLDNSLWEMGLKFITNINYLKFVDMKEIPKTLFNALPTSIIEKRWIYSDLKNEVNVTMNKLEDFLASNLDVSTDNMFERDDLLDNDTRSNIVENIPGSDIIVRQRSSTFSNLLRNGYNAIRNNSVLNYIRTSRFGRISYLSGVAFYKTMKKIIPSTGKFLLQFKLPFLAAVLATQVNRIPRSIIPYILTQCINYTSAAQFGSLMGIKNTLSYYTNSVVDSGIILAIPIVTTFIVHSIKQYMKNQKPSSNIFRDKSKLKSFIKYSSYVLFISATLGIGIGLRNEISPLMSRVSSSIIPNGISNLSILNSFDGDKIYDTARLIQQQIKKILFTGQIMNTLSEAKSGIILASKNVFGSVSNRLTEMADMLPNVHDMIRSNFTDIGTESMVSNVTNIIDNSRVQIASSISQMTTNISNYLPVLSSKLSSVKSVFSANLSSAIPTLNIPFIKSVQESALYYLRQNIEYFNPIEELNA